MVSLFCTAHDLWPGDAAFASLVCRIEQDCPEFGTWWASHRVAAPTAGTKRLHHATLGLLDFDYASLQANDDPGLKLALYRRR